MSDKKIIFKSGEITYPKEWYLQNGLKVKPVVYSDNFLKNIADTTYGSSLELTHGNAKLDVVGHISDFEFTDGELLATVVSNESDEGMGYSPEFGVNFRDLGDKYEAIDGQLLKTVLTDSPRSHILCNSVEGGSGMNEELIDNLNKQIKDLNKEVAQKDATIKANSEKLAKYDELSQRVTELEEQNADYKVKIDSLQPKAEAFIRIEDEKRAELLTKAFDDDEEAKKPWLDASMEQLETLANHREITRQAHGVGAGSGEGIGELPEDNDDEPRPEERAMAFYKKLHGDKIPSFLKEGGE